MLDQGDGDQSAAPGARGDEATDDEPALPPTLSMERGGPTSRFVEQLYRELRKMDRLERRRRGF